MMTAKPGADTIADIRMETAKGGGYTTVMKKPRLALWEQELVETNPEVKRKATVAKMPFLPSKYWKGGISPA